MSLALLILLLGVWWIKDVVAFCPLLCACNEEILTTTCNNTKLEVIPLTLNPSVKRLSVTHSNISVINPVLQFYRDLEFLDLSHNRITAINPDSFDGQRKLQKLLVSHNLILNLWQNMFRGLKDLKLFDLSNNILEILPDKAFVHLNSLEELDISNNRITSLNPDAFFGLHTLQTLRLRGNRLKQVPTASFRPLSSLSYLDLGNNSLSRLVTASFAPLFSLKRLDLDKCNLINFSNDVFRELQNLRSLHLHNNPHTDFPMEVLKPLSRIEELTLSPTTVKEIEGNMLRGLGGLRILEVNGAPHLTTIRRKAFANNPDLNTLRLISNPKLAVLEEGGFDGVTRLRHLSLRGNAFTSFRKELLPWEELESLDLLNNPLECNSSLLWLSNLLQVKNFQRHEPVATCRTPANLRFRNLVEFSSNDLAFRSAAKNKPNILFSAIDFMMSTVAFILVTMDEAVEALMIF